MILESQMMLPVLFSNPCIIIFPLINADASVMCYIHLHLYAVTSDHYPGFPDLEIVGCPARYDPQNEVYEIDFQWNVPFSPAALSHIQLMSLRIDVMLKLNDDFTDFTVLRPGVFSGNVTVNVS